MRISIRDAMKRRTRLARKPRTKSSGRKKARRQTAILTLAILLAISSILRQACSIAWYLLEDGLLLNIGSVTGVTAATVVLLGLMIKRQIYIGQEM